MGETKEYTFEVLKQKQSKLIKQRKDIGRYIYKNQLLIKSCEAKLNRVDPLSEEYNETLNIIDNTYEETKKLQLERLRLSIIEYDLENVIKEK